MARLRALHQLRTASSAVATPVTAVDDGVDPLGAVCVLSSSGPPVAGPAGTAGDVARGQPSGGGYRADDKPRRMAKQAHAAVVQTVQRGRGPVVSTKLRPVSSLHMPFAVPTISSSFVGKSAAGAAAMTLAEIQAARASATKKFSTVC